MSETEPTYSLDNLPDDIPANPGWKPLAWFAGAIVLLIALGEVLVVFGWELMEFIGEGIFLAVEGSEEFLEDAVEGWFELEPWEAEMYTAWVTSPFKLLLAFFVLRALWRWKKNKAFPAVKRWLLRRWLIIRLSWRGLWWPWKACVMTLGVGVLVILI